MQVQPITVIMGRSGTGKSTSIRNLDPSSTAIINTEFKPLPFRESNQFKISYLQKSEDIFQLLLRAKDNKDIKVVVIDSFTQWSNDLGAFCERTKKGYDRQNLYNNLVHDFFNTLKRLGKPVFIMCHEEVDTTAEGETIKQVKVEYKRKKGIVEESALVWIYATIVFEGEDRSPVYKFQVQPDPLNPAKAPAGMFEQKYIDNDLNIVLDAFTAYYGQQKVEDSPKGKKSV